MVRSVVQSSLATAQSRTAFPAASSPLTHALRELEETLENKSPNFRARVVTPGDRCPSCMHQNCHACIPVREQVPIFPSANCRHPISRRSTSPIKHGDASYQRCKRRQDGLPSIHLHRLNQVPEIRRTDYGGRNIVNVQPVSLKARGDASANGYVVNCKKQFEEGRARGAGASALVDYSNIKPMGAHGTSEDENIAALSGKFSALKAEFKSFWEGQHSPRQHIEFVRQRHESTQELIQSLEEGQQCLKERIKSLEQETRERNESLERMKQERIDSLQQTKKACPANSKERIVKQRMKALTNRGEHRPENNQLELSSDAQEMRKIAEFWCENNCDFHVNRIVYSLRQIAAYEILDFAHKRLTSHMMNHMHETAKRLEEKKQPYQRMFGLSNDDEDLNTELQGDSSNAMRPLILEGTYAELLHIVQQQMQEGKKVKKEWMGALKAAEKGLLKEAEGEGYKAEEVGDVRWQMTGFWQLEKKFNRRYHMQGRSKMTQYNWASDQGDEEAREVVEDIRRAAEEGDLGVLDRASKLVILGCYFLHRQLMRNYMIPDNLASSAGEIDAQDLHLLSLHSDDDGGPASHAFAMKNRE